MIPASEPARLPSGRRWQVRRSGSDAGSVLVQPPAHRSEKNWSSAKPHHMVRKRAWRKPRRLSRSSLAPGAWSATHTSTCGRGARALRRRRAGGGAGVRQGGTDEPGKSLQRSAAQCSRAAGNRASLAHNSRRSARPPARPTAPGAAGAACCAPPPRRRGCSPTASRWGSCAAGRAGSSRGESEGVMESPDKLGWAELNRQRRLPACLPSQSLPGRSKHRSSPAREGGVAVVGRADVDDDLRREERRGGEGAMSTARVRGSACGTRSGRPHTAAGMHSCSPHSPPRAPAGRRWRRTGISPSGRSRRAAGNRE